MTEEKKAESEERRRTGKIASYVPKERTPAVAWLRYNCEPAYICDMRDEEGNPTAFAEEMINFLCVRNPLTTKPRGDSTLFAFSGCLRPQEPF